jgi:hypothetical protein
VSRTQRTLGWISRTSVWIIAIPVLLMFLGAASNQLVLIANHGTFPVMVPATSGMSEMLDDVHCVMTEKTHLNLLADVFNFKIAIESVGDLLIDLGEFLWLFAPYLWAYVVIGKLSACRGQAL